MEIKRTFDILPYALSKYPLNNCLVSKVDGKWKNISTQEYSDQVNQLSNALIELGVQPGDRIATINNNRPEWNILNVAVAQVGAIICPMYPTISADDYVYIFNHAEISYVFVSDEEILGKVLKAKESVPTVKDIYTFDKIDNAKHWSEVFKLNKGQHNDEIAKRKEAITENNLVTIIYTSGTTGKPKGVMLSHQNLVSNAKAAQALLPCLPGDKALSFLPVCHVFERTLLNIYVQAGISIYYAESIETLGDNLKEIKPEIFTAVPRLIEKLYDKIIAGGNLKSGVIKKLFFWAVNKANNYEIGQSSGIGDLIANKLIYSKVQAGLGGNIKCIISGSAALQPRLTKFFWGVGLPILEGYGLTETSPTVAVNSLLHGGTKFSTVGKVLEGVSVKIEEDGEILVKGSNVMLGYYKDETLTSEVMSDEWFHTGDIGVFDGEYLKITDRKKEIFKTSGGKYIAPGPVENTMKASPFIEQIMVIGEGEKHAAALIVPAFIYIKEWCKEQGIPCSTNDEICSNEKVRKAINADIDKFNQKFGKVEQIKKIELINSDWTILGGELTPTMKPKRKPILKKYDYLLKKIYGDDHC
jgi:long-chain acyl-CoA synthetase